MNDGIDASRRASAPDGPVDLSEVAEQGLAKARGLSVGRAARTLTPVSGGGLKQTVLALTAGSRLPDHRAPGPASIHILHGLIRLSTASGVLELSAGQWAPIPDETHDLLALSDAAILLTVASGTL